MHTGRKILNLRHDRSVSQQDLARACLITPSALSKIESGVNSPRANILWRIAGQLSVTVEYLLDERMPYPYPGQEYRQKLVDANIDPESIVRSEMTRQERAFLEALRNSSSIAEEIAYTLPEASVEKLRLLHFVLNHSTIENPDPDFLAHFERLLTTGVPYTAEEFEEKKLERSRRGRKKSASEEPPKSSSSKRSSAKKATKTTRTKKAGSTKKPAAKKSAAKRAARKSS